MATIPNKSTSASQDQQKYFITFVHGHKNFITVRKKNLKVCMRTQKSKEINTILNKN